MNIATKDFIIIAIIFASISLMIDAIYTVKKQYKNGKITSESRNYYIRIILIVPLLGALLVYSALKR